MKILEASDMHGHHEAYRVASGRHRRAFLIDLELMEHQILNTNDEERLQ